MLERIYQNRNFKRVYTYILIGFTTIFIFVIPFFMKRNYFFGSFWADLIVRGFLTTCSFQSIRYISNIDDAYKEFYKGAKKLEFSKPDLIKQIVNVVSAIGSGITAVIFYLFTLSLFATYLGLTLIIIFSVIIGVSVAIPMFLQFKKR